MPAEPTAIVPDKGIRGCLNIGTADIPKGTFVVLTTGATDEPFSIAISGDGAQVLGVAMEDILGTTAAAVLGFGAQRGNIQVSGKALVLAGAAVARGAAVGSNASGSAIVAATGDIVAGAGGTVGVSTELMEVELAGPGGGHIAA